MFIGINIVVYFELLKSFLFFGKVCVSVYYVWFNGDWKCFVFVVFYYLDDFYLYYNMVLFVWKGMLFEGRMGSLRFLYVLVVFIVLINMVLVVFDIVLVNIIEDYFYIYICVVGFLGVIFVLKVFIIYNLFFGVFMVMGMFFVFMRWVCWVELIVI